MAQAFKAQWWMYHYTASTPKLHYGFSNSPRISKLNRGMLRGWARKDEPQGGVRTAEIYRNSQARVNYATKEQKHWEKLSPQTINCELWLNQDVQMFERYVVETVFFVNIL